MAMQSNGISTGNVTYSTC